MNRADAKLLERCISMGSSSLLQYVSESFPWSGDQSSAALDRVIAIAHEERAAVTSFIKDFQRNRLRLPPMGSFPSHFTTMNFVSLDYLVPRLIAEHASEIAEIESRLPQETDEEVRRLAHGYLEMKRTHLQTLIGLAPHKAPADAA